MNGSKIKIKEDIPQKGLTPERLKWITIIVLTNALTILLFNTDQSLPNKIKGPNVDRGNKLLVLPIKSSVPIAKNNQKMEVSLLKKNGQIIGPLWLHSHINDQSSLEATSNLLLEAPEYLISTILTIDPKNLTVIPKTKTTLKSIQRHSYEILF